MIRISVWVLCCCWPCRQYGQSVTGQISGTLTDETGAVVPGAAVRLYPI